MYINYPSVALALDGWNCSERNRRIATTGANASHTTFEKGSVVA